jgi:hypothetical protein
LKSSMYGAHCSAEVSLVGISISSNSLLDT